jgi:hypothetical protein
LTRRDKRWLREKFRQYPNAGIGMLVGPRRDPQDTWLAELDGDGSQASDCLTHYGDFLVTLGWFSRRGAHHVRRLRRRF